ncbi:MAG: enoyl-CoA hydratase [Phenylobacterium sp.]|uniref:enoyl-CoA hydratase n=1 Tax=Phenylobacterium sp. TaxID=1871053 RepID=UPI00391A6AB3
MLNTEIIDGVAVLTMNRPEAMNALSKALRESLAKAFPVLDADPKVRVVVLTGAGERAFTAGLDLKELGADPAALSAANPAANPAGAVADPVGALLACRKPVIGAINGVAITGGFELALACDVLVCSTNARFADTHGRVGITPGWGLSQRLSRVIGPYRAKELSLTGNFLDARTACDWGLVNRVVEPEDLMPTALALARDMSQIDASMLADLKAMIDDGYALPLGEGLKLEDERSRRRNAQVRPEQVEARRAGVLARGRSQ